MKRHDCKIIHPLNPTGGLYPIQTVLNDLAGQEGCDGEPYDTMIRAAEYITYLERETVPRPDPKEVKEKIHSLTRAIVHEAIHDDYLKIYNYPDTDQALTDLLQLMSMEE